MGRKAIEMLLQEPRKLADCGCFPTPLHRLNRLSQELGCNIFLKRDDLTGLGFSGNKIRKLQYLVQDALDRGCTTLLTYGGVQSNHARQTAAVAAKYGLRSVLIATLKTDRPPAALSGNLLLDAILNCDVIFMDTSSIQAQAGRRTPDEIEAETARLRRRAADLVIREYEAKGERVYEIPAGGSTPLGCLGYFYAVPEIMQQLAEMGQTVDYLICPSGSKGTFSGLWLGARYFQAPFRVVGSCVSPHGDAYRESVRGLIGEMCALYGLGAPPAADELCLYCSEYSGPAYDTPDPLTFETIYRLALAEGLFVDPCYSAKGLTALLKLVEDHTIPAGSNVLFIHTGGLPALYSEQHLAQFNRDLWGSRQHRVISLPVE